MSQRRFEKITDKSMDAHDFGYGDLRERLLRVSSLAIRLDFCHRSEKRSCLLIELLRIDVIAEHLLLLLFFFQRLNAKDTSTEAELSSGAPESKKMIDKRGAYYPF